MTRAFSKLLISVVSIVLLAFVAGLGWSAFRAGVALGERLLLP